MTAPTTERTGFLARLFHWLLTLVRTKLAGHRHLVLGAGSMFVAMGVQAGGGWLYWLVATHSASSDTIGRATALFSTTSFVVFLTNFGLVITVARLASNDEPEHELRFGLATATTFVTSAIGAAIAGVFLVSSGRAADVGPSGLVVTLFVLLTATFSLMQLVDTRLMGLRRTNLVVLRSAVSAIAKTALLVFALPDTNQALWLFVFLLLPDALTGLGGTLYLGRRVVRWLREGLRVTHLRELVRFSGAAYISQGFVNAPTYTLPFVVALTVPASENASFFLAWSFALFVGFLVPQATTLALHVEGNRETDDVASQLRLGLLATVGFTSLCFLASFIAAKIIPLLYGTAYELAAQLLPWLIAGCIPWAVVFLLLAEARIRANLGRTLVISGVGAVLCLTPELILTLTIGVNGAAAGWIIGATLAAAFAGAVRKFRPLTIPTAAEAEEPLPAAAGAAPVEGGVLDESFTALKG